MFNNLTTEDGYKTTLEDFFRLGNVFVGKDDVPGVILGVSNKELAEEDPSKVTVIYRLGDKTDIRSCPVLEFLMDFKLVKKEFEIWIPWYQATGESYPAQMIEKKSAYTFNEAIYLHYKEANRLEGIELRNGIYCLIGWGRFYDNEASAKA